MRMALLVFCIAGVVLVAGCSSDSGSRAIVATPVCGYKWVTKIDYKRYLEDGVKISWNLDPGTYRVKVVSLDEGIRVGIWDGGKWVRYTEEIVEYYETIELHQGGGIVIENPTVFGLGRGANIHVYVEKYLYTC